MERNKYDREEKILISLPERFLEDVKVILEDEYEQFINSYNEKKYFHLQQQLMVNLNKYQY